MATYTKRGSRWLAQVRRKGHPSINQTFETKAQAVEWAVEQEARILRGEGGHGNGQLTVRDIVQRYLETVTPGKRSSETETYRLLKLSTDPICNFTLKMLTPKQIAEYRDRRLAMVRPGTICRELSLLHHMFDLARREWGLWSLANPVRDVRKPILKNARTRRLSQGEWERLRAALARSRNPFILPAVCMALETALRRGELLNLRWSNFNWDASTVFIPHTKTGKPRTVPLSPDALSLLDPLRKEADFVFPMTSNACKLAWRRAVDRAGIDDLRFHDLRHEAVSRFFEKGLSLPEVALISGHQDPRMLFRYTHLRAETVAQKLRQLIDGKLPKSRSENLLE